MAGLSKTALLTQVAKNLGNTFFQDVGTLKAGAAFWATWIQILLRCAVSVKSSITAPPDDAYFIRRQSAQVLFRELVGGTLGFGVVKQIDKMLKNAIAKASGYEIVKPATTSFGTAFKQMKAILQNKLTHVEAAPIAQTGQTLYKKTGELKPALLKLGAFLQKHGRLAKDLVEPAELEKAAFKWAHTVPPVAIGSVVSIALAGWWLERTTLFHGDKVVDFITGDKVKHPGALLHRGHGAVKQPLAQSPLSSVAAVSGLGQAALPQTASLNWVSSQTPAATVAVAPHFSSLQKPPLLNPSESSLLVARANLFNR